MDRLLDPVLSTAAEPTPQAVRFATHCALDWLGVALAGADQPAPTAVAAALAGAAGEVGLIGRDSRAAAIDAAMVNGTAGHALDYDDTIEALPGHATGVVLPALLAVGARTRPSGAELLAALVAGVELTARLGLAAGPEHYRAGFHATSTLGPFGAAVACGLLLDLDRDRLSHALGIAASQAAGLKAQFGSAAKPFQAGRAAADGARAALLAEAGLQAAPDAIEGPNGFLDAFRGGAPRKAGGGAAQAWPNGGAAIEQTFFKRHVTCHLTHASIEAARELSRRGLAADRVERIFVTAAPGLAGVCDVAEPRDATSAKFSLRFAVAMGLAGTDTTDPSTFTDALALDPELVALRDRVEVELDAEGRPLTWSALRALTVDREELSAEHDVGVPEADLDRQESFVAGKARTLAEAAIGAEDADRLVAACLDLASAADPVAELDGLVCRAGPRE